MNKVKMVSTNIFPISQLTNYIIDFFNIHFQESELKGLSFFGAWFEWYTIFFHNKALRRLGFHKNLLFET